MAFLGERVMIFNENSIKCKAKSMKDYEMRQNQTMRFLIKLTTVTRKKGTFNKGNVEFNTFMSIFICSFIEN